MKKGDEVWCRYPDCGESIQIIAVPCELPEFCPSCQREGRWTTERQPGHPWILSLNDQRFLRSLKIAATDDPDDRLGASEGSD